MEEYIRNIKGFTVAQLKKLFKERRLKLAKGSKKRVPDIPHSLGRGPPITVCSMGHKDDRAEKEAEIKGKEENDLVIKKCVLLQPGPRRAGAQAG
ncbi:hypothetical protein NDU88_002471 [Pleurodeles waltl]|uniref:Uncharacterized protein n=1 Tax=Pleurodeles waltl TaxID=8319 RepID=A0AAV7TLW1_PLEWA|nr:hypothetical protein NDU88_002471 [Pleurodeles waltl]